ncbi:MAG: hypothetical protein L0221_03945 [Chloroflexi bacterium]|nr:hypothetical protein [Chloroflexota bacterium]
MTGEERSGLDVEHRRPIDHQVHRLHGSRRAGAEQVAGEDGRDRPAHGVPVTNVRPFELLVEGERN